MNQWLHDALWQVLFGWTQLVPVEAWWVLGGVAALLVLRFLGWQGLVALAAAVGYYLGVKRGVEIEKAQSPPPTYSRPPNTQPRPRPKTLIEFFNRRD